MMTFVVIPVFVPPWTFEVVYCSSHSCCELSLSVAMVLWFLSGRRFNKYFRVCFVRGRRLYKCLKIEDFRGWRRGGGGGQGYGALRCWVAIPVG